MSRWIVVFAFVVFSSLQLSAAEKSEKPNVVFIAIDDLNDWLGCLQGHPQVQTPNIDRLASRGTLFTNAHCQSPLCNPSRTSVLMGKRPSSTGIYGLAPWIRKVPEFTNLVSLPQHFSKNGYKTFTGGKIYHNVYGRRKDDKEWDVIGPGSGVGIIPKKKNVKTPGGHKLLDWGWFDHKDEQKQDYKVATWAVEQLNKKHEKPFFLTLGFFLPHVPLYATKKWFDLYPEDTLLLPPILENDRDDTPRFSWYLHWKLPEPRLKFLKESNELKNKVRSYLACISFIDHQVGRVLKAIDSNGYRDNTMIVLWSDHGYHLGEKGISGKNTLWKRSTRVPLIFSGPGVSMGGRCAEPVELLDIYPTLIDLCGLTKNDQLEGLSLIPQLRHPNALRTRPAITTHNHDNHSIVTRNWRYIIYADGSEELYDSLKDPNEFHNLASDPKYSKIKKFHRAYIPKINRKPAPGSKYRVLTHDKEKTVWQGEVIHPNDPIPEF